MILALGLVWSIVAVLSGLIFRRTGVTGLMSAGTDALQTFKSLVFRLPCALLAVSFLIQIVPVNTVSSLIGPNSGAVGIIIAAAAGGFLPGGPMVSFPIAIVFLQGGTGLPQLVALISGWSVFALHRLLAYEAPIMGWRFVALRSISCLALPVVAGLSAEALVILLGNS